MIFSLFVDAAIIGLIVAFMERGEFPGWGPTLGSALFIIVTRTAVSYALPTSLWPLSHIAGAAVGGVVISWFCGMTFQRATLAAGIYLAISSGIYLLFALAATA